MCPQKFRKEAGRVENRRSNPDQNYHSIVMTGQNTEKSPENLRRIAVTPVKNYQPNADEKNSQ